MLTPCRRPACIVLAVAVLLPVSPRPAAAWSGPGHAAVAAIAYRQLPPEVRARCIEILRHHTDFPRWQSDYEKLATSLPPHLDLGLYLFIRASTWPDEIRRQGANPYDHPNWHFVDFAVQQSDLSATGAEPAPADDILHGIRESERVLADPGATAEAQAAHLSWLIHLVGDIHQPLHCATLVNATAYPPPDGDRGGNSFYIRPNLQVINLHAFWDQQLGSAQPPPPRQALNDAILLETEHGRASLPQLAAPSAPLAWSHESLGAAVRHAYQYQETVQGAPRLIRLPGSATQQDAPPLPAGYSKQSQQVARERIALAGYRLADLLRSLPLPAAAQAGAAVDTPR
jgi:hypothetical protein